MRTLIKLIKWSFGGVVILLFGGLAVMYLADPVLTTRLVGLPFGAAQGPEERVAGGPPIRVPTAAPDQRTISQAAIDAAVAYGADTGSHALLIYHAGAIQLEHYYPGYDAQHRSPTQSMHKSVLAMLVGIAIEDGQIGSLDDRAARYLTEWAGDARADITLRQMLQQSSGIAYPTVGFNPLGGFFQLVLGDEIKPLTLNQPQEVTAGSRFDYNSINPQALGIIIERATGLRYAEYLSRALWRHLGTPDATVLLDDEGGMARTFCCLNASARAWLHVGLLHLNGGRVGDRQVVPAKWMAAITEPGPHNPNYGFLTWLGTEYQEYRHYNRKAAVRVYHSEPYLAADVIYFDGFGGQRVYVVPSRRLVIVRTGAIRNDWDDAYLVNTAIRGL